MSKLKINLIQVAFRSVVEDAHAWRSISGHEFRKETGYGRSMEVNLIHMSLGLVVVGSFLYSPRRL